MDLAQKAHFFTLDTITDVASGAPIGHLEHDVDVFDYLKTTASALPALVMGASVPAIQNFINIPFIAKRLFPTAEDEIGFGKLIGWVTLITEYVLAADINLKDCSKENRRAIFVR